jgi:hypothetical protein
MKLELSPRHAGLYAAPKVVLVIGTITYRIRKAQLD